MANQALQALIIDDSVTDLRVLSALLREKLHCKVETAADGLDGLHKLSMQHFDIVFLDLVMPVMGGVEVLEEIRGSVMTTDIPVVILSGDAEAETVRLMLRFNVFDYIVKPINTAELVPRFTEKLNTLRSYLGVSGSVVIPPENAANKENREIVLIVDGDVNFRRFCANAMSNRFHVIAAASGAQAISIATKTPPRYILLGARHGVFDRDRMVARLRKLPALAATRLFAISSDPRNLENPTPPYDGAIRWSFHTNAFRAEFDRVIAQSGAGQTENLSQTDQATT